MSRWVARMLAVAALAPLALPARAAAQTFTTTGSITYTWQGDPARGCAAEGLCAVQGAVILQPEGSVGVATSGSSRRPVVIPLAPAAPTVRVSDGTGAGECVDGPSSAGPGGDLVITHGAGGGLVAHINSGLSSGRCAGPLQRELAAAALPVRRTAGKHPSFDVNASRSFTAGPFIGRLVSTLVVRTGTGGGGSELVSSSPVQVQPAPTHRVFLEQITLRYRIASLPGTLDASFSGEPDPFCATLDACGATGSLALSLPGFRGALVISASRIVPTRVDARQAEADLRRGRLHPGGAGTSPFGAGAAAQVSETFAGAGDWRCQDTSRDGPGQVLVGTGPARSTARVSVVLNSPFGLDLLRTHCPGPSESDVFGDSPALGRGTIGLSQLLARHSVISLTAPGSFAGAGYLGSRSGALRFSLFLERIRGGTVEVARP